jgi:CO dehydrogenase/acetyl-CoA synthase delta subunit
MRKLDSVNDPFITIEIFDDELRQAYHRFNEDCTPEEADWIRKYCKRHGIGMGKFEFNIDVDRENL